VAGAALASLPWFFLHQRARESGEFGRERLGLLEAENARLRGVVEAHGQREQAAADTGRRAEIERLTAAERGLAFLRPVEYETLARARVPEVIREKLEEHYAAEDYQRLGEAYSAMGLLPEGYDLQKGIVALLGEQLAAFYDQHADRLFLLEGTRLDRANDRMILAHELTHALQDQHFGLENFPLADKENDDRVMALSALIEGDATVLMTRFLARDGTRFGASDFTAGLFGQDLAELARAPRFLRESLLFPYVQGQRFCDVVVAHGGMEAVNRAFRDPPRSTAEILDPSRYLAPALRPSREFAVAMEPPPGWKLVATNVAGRFGIECLLDEWIGGAGEGAADWEADRYWVFRDDGGRVQVGWRTRWRTSEAAERFERDLQKVFEARAAREGSRDRRRQIQRDGVEVRVTDAVGPVDRATVLEDRLGRVEVRVADARDPERSETP